jgi:hypothetical protein
MTEEGVLPNITNPEPTTSTESPVSEPQAQQPLTKDAVQKMIEEAEAKGKEDGRRNLQSQQDKNRAEAERQARRAQQAETNYNALKMRMRELDPDSAKELDLAELRAQAQNKAQEELQERQRQQQTEFHGQFRERQVNYIKSLGLNPEDKRIDWADDAPNYLDALSRTLSSVKVLQDEQVKTTKSGLEKRLKEMEESLKRLNIDVNSVSTPASSGAGEGSDADFKRKFGNGDLPLTQKNIARYESIIASY